MPKSFLLFLILTISGTAFAQSRKAAYYQSRAEDYLSHKKYKDVEQFADSALQLIVRSNNRDSIIAGYMWLYEIHTTAGNYEKAIDDYKHAEVFRDSVASEKRDSIESVLKSKLGDEIKAHAEEALALDTKVRDLIASSAIDRRNSYILLSSLFVIGIIAVIAL